MPHRFDGSVFVPALAPAVAKNEAMRDFANGLCALACEEDLVHVNNDLFGQWKGVSESMVEMKQDLPTAFDAFLMKKYWPAFDATIQRRLSAATSAVAEKVLCFVPEVDVHYNASVEVIHVREGLVAKLNADHAPMIQEVLKEK